ncbi:MAG TPA: DUF302 domain-containing protein [Flavobacteriaceae bacterium]|nr:DUF302 domain-containing protein [Flavobacteriaceae bacterium]
MNGLISIVSEFSVQESIDRVADLLKQRDYKIFGRIDHRKNAAPYKNLRPTQIIIFGNPKVGTNMMLDAQTVAIDLPSKIMAWEDENGKVHLVHNDMNWLAERHQLTVESQDAVDKIQNTLRQVCEKAAKGE